MFKNSPRRLVLAPCPRQDALIPTHAYMSVRRLALRSGPLFYWCPTCKVAHRAEADALRHAWPRPPEAADASSRLREGEVHRAYPA